MTGTELVVDGRLYGGLSRHPPIMSSGAHHGTYRRRGRQSSDYGHIMGPSWGYTDGIGYVLIVLTAPAVNEFTPDAAAVCALFPDVHPRVGRRPEQAV
ncbi:hypothetical protein AB0N06_08685 [Streptomyces sp. NPDC051020]|uniref:hypothetical protein n=1 Tax=Streptomyces sp. NPDC051020 TaxID=3155409 RepID=UPI0034252713